jgi:hypothetical protein
MKNDKHIVSIPASALTSVQNKINDINAILASCIVPLTPEERHDLPKMGEKTLAFVEKAYDFAKQNPNLVPPYLDVPCFGVDFEDAHGLWGLVNSVRQLYENLNDTEMAAGSVTKSLRLFVLGVLLRKTPRNNVRYEYAG